VTSLKSFRIVVLVVVSLFLLGLPLFTGQFVSYLMLTFFAYAITVVGFNLLFGYTGLLSFGHALFMAVGAYTAAFLTSKFSILYMEVILVASVIVASILAALIGAICVRYIKIYFAMLTLAFGMLFYTFLLKFYYLTGGDEGMRVLRPYLLGFNFSEVPKMEFLTGSYYLYMFVILAILMFVMWKIISSPFGLCLKAIRDNPEKAEYLGVSVRKYRWYAFVISAAYAAIGGALLAPAIGQVDPGLTYWTHSGTLVFMTLLGGFENFFGPLIGGVVYIFLQDKIMSLTAYWRFIFGGILAFIVIAAPGGIAGVISSLLKGRKS
ncbi:MAG: branched-chain amino acid ABC transporter permease, partial [Thermodesulfobacteriota bacterium]